MERTLQAQAPTGRAVNASIQESPLNPHGWGRFFSEAL